MSSRDIMLRRIRAAIGPAPAPGTAEVPRGYRTNGGHALGSPALLDLLEQRLLDYRARVRRSAAADLPQAIAEALDEHRARTVVAPAGIPSTWLPAEAIVDDGTLDATALDAVDAVVTGCAIAIAETGTVVLDGSPDQGRRILSLMPDLHVCVVPADRVVHLLPEALPRLRPQAPLTWISGPSATSDIELDRVEGVHGPRRLEVILSAP